MPREHGARQIIGRLFRLPTEQISREDRIWNQFVAARGKFFEGKNSQQLAGVVPTSIDLIANPKVAKPFKQRALREYTQGQYKGDLPIDLLQQEGLIPEAVEIVSELEESAAKNLRIIQLVGVLPDDRSQELVSQIHLGSGNGPVYYEQVEGLLRSNLDEKWKRTGVADRIHAFIRDEQTGRHHAVRQLDQPTHDYLSALSMLLYSEKLPVSERFYEDEVRFLLDTVPGILFDQWHIGRVMNIIKDPVLRHRFARRHVLTEKFSIYDATLEAANQIMAEFPEDTELVGHLLQKFQEWEEAKVRMAQNKEQEATEEAGRLNALNQAIEAMQVKSEDSSKK